MWGDNTAALKAKCNVLYTLQIMNFVLKQFESSFFWFVLFRLQLALQSSKVSEQGGRRP